MTDQDEFEAWLGKLVNEHKREGCRYCGEAIAEHVRQIGQAVWQKAQDEIQIIKEYNETNSDLAKVRKNEINRLEEEINDWALEAAKWKSGCKALKQKTDKLAKALDVCVRDLQSISVVNDSEKQQALAVVCKDDAEQALEEYRDDND